MRSRLVSQLLYPLAGIVLIIAVWALACWLINIPTVVLPSPDKVLRAFVARSDLLLSEGWITPQGDALRLPAGAGGRPAARGRGRQLAAAQPDVLSAADRAAVGAESRARADHPGVARHRPRIEARDRVAGRVLPHHRRHRRRAARHAEGAAGAGAQLDAPLQIFLKVQLPAALPFIVTGAKVAITLAVIGAVIGEFVGSSEGLGYLLLSATSQLDTPLAFAALFALAALGMFVYALVELGERMMAPWLPPARH